MLSPEDRRRLDLIESETAATDPEFARRLRRHPYGRWFEIFQTLGLLVTGAVGVVVGTLTGDLVVFLVAGVIPMLAWTRLRCYPDPKGRGSTQRQGRTQRT